MCLILFSYNTHQEFPFILAANRDESYKRPTEPAHFWNDYPLTLAGRDLEKLGTWMGVTKAGRFAALTNYRNPQDSPKGKESRGNLVANYLNNASSPEDYLSVLVKRRNVYQGYNIIFGDFESLWYYSNINNEPKKLTPGIYGLSNHLLNTSWPKVERGIRGLEECSTREKLDKECLFSMLNDAEEAPTSQLPKTGVSLELERKLSPLFIKMEDYGTRSSTIITLNKKNRLCFTERTYQGSEIKTRDFSFDIKPSF